MNVYTCIYTPTYISKQLSWAAKDHGKNFQIVLVTSSVGLYISIQSKVGLKIDKDTCDLFTFCLFQIISLDV